MFWIGLILGINIGVLILACFRNSRPEREEPFGIDEREKLRLTMCAECPHPGDAKAIEEMYKSCLHALRTKQGEHRESQKKLCCALGELNRLQNPWVAVGD
jgi:hypothetical protein